MAIEAFLVEATKTVPAIVRSLVGRSVDIGSRVAESPKDARIDAFQIGCLDVATAMPEVRTNVFAAFASVPADMGQFRGGPRTRHAGATLRG